MLHIGGLDAVVVDKPLLSAAASGRRKYIEYRERQRADKAKAVIRKALSDEIMALEKRQTTVQCAMLSMTKDADSLTVRASRGAARHDTNHEIESVPPVCEGERRGTCLVGKENCETLWGLGKCAQISKCRNIQYCKLNTVQIAYIVTIVMMRSDECGIVGLTLS